MGIPSKRPGKIAYVGAPSSVERFLRMMSPLFEETTGLTTAAEANDQLCLRRADVVLVEDQLVDGPGTEVLRNAWLRLPQSVGFLVADPNPPRPPTAGDGWRIVASTWTARELEYVVHGALDVVAQRRRETLYHVEALARAVVTDANTYLTVILGYSDILRKDLTKLALASRERRIDLDALGPESDRSLQDLIENVAGLDQAAQGLVDLAHSVYFFLDRRGAMPGQRGDIAAAIRDSTRYSERRWHRNVGEFAAESELPSVALETDRLSRLIDFMINLVPFTGPEEEAVDPATLRAAAHEGGVRISLRIPTRSFPRWKWESNLEFAAHVSALLQVFLRDACGGHFDVITDDGATTFSAWLPARREP